VKENNLFNLIRRQILLFLICMSASAFTLCSGQDSSKKSIKYPSKTKKSKKKKRAETGGEIGLIRYGIASYYDNKFTGRKTATGELFEQTRFTCACNVAPLGTWVKVTNLSNGKEVVVKVNDRLHPNNQRIVDLSKIAARRLDFLDEGITRVKVEVIGEVEGRVIPKRK
jgi:rare lipoprotein A